MASVIEVNNLEQLQSYRLAWKSLLPQTPKTSFFHTFDWFETYWKHYGASRKMRVLIVQAEGRPIGIVPLCVQKERYHVGKVRVLTYPLSDWGLWYGPIGPNQSATMFMAARHLRDTRRDWDLLDLRWTPNEQRVRNGLSRSLKSVGWGVQEREYQQTSNIELEGQDWESYFAKRSKKWRHETRRQKRALANQGEVTFERYRPLSAAEGEGDPNWDFYESCLAVSKQSWQATSRTGNTLCHEHVQPFLRDCHATAARLGMVDMTMLRLDGTPIAFQYNYLYDGTIFGLRMGYDNNLAHLSAGSNLLNESLQDSFQRGDRLIEMGIGESRYKQRVRTSLETSYRLTYYPWSAWRAQGVRLTQALKGQSSALQSKARQGHSIEN